MVRCAVESGYCKVACEVAFKKTGSAKSGTRSERQMESELKIPHINAEHFKLLTISLYFDLIKLENHS